MQEQLRLLQGLARLPQPCDFKNRSSARTDVAGRVPDCSQVEKRCDDGTILTDQAALQIRHRAPFLDGGIRLREVLGAFRGQQVGELLPSDELLPGIPQPGKLGGIHAGENSILVDCVAAARRMLEPIRHIRRGRRICRGMHAFLGVRFHGIRQRMGSLAHTSSGRKTPEPNSFAGAAKGTEPERCSGM